MTRRSCLWTYVEEQIRIRLDVAGEVRSGCLKGANCRQPLARNDLVPRAQGLHADHVDLPPTGLTAVGLRLREIGVNDVAVRGKRNVPEPRAEHAREIDRRWVVDAIPRN